MNNEENQRETKSIEKITDEEFLEIIFDFTKTFYGINEDTQINGNTSLKENFHFDDKKIDNFFYGLGECFEDSFSKEFRSLIGSNYDLGHIAKITKRYLLGKISISSSRH